ncbi:hypothetical protein TrLO_g870 [Triparma laevis f. longispina]|uniref:Uncharacterized protein n=1 Tax=Triparma laevis f. longispina TaxID=1714387 RepID=A0A9W6Z9J6_9STRA|nr:hypothetical protein TrLO_g870 [Triparma laevis f. longispina]
MKALGLGGVMKETMHEVGQQFLIVVRNSSRDVASDVIAWAIINFPSDDMTAEAKENITEFFVSIAVQIRVLMKMMMTFFQYAKKSKGERFGRTLAALLGLGPLVEGASLWTGKEDDDLMVSGPAMYATMKAIEIAFESIPESFIQISALLKQNYGDIKTIQTIGVISSIVSGAFIMADGNFGFMLSKCLESPGNPY